MAEIKSTMELVLERAARMGKASSEEIANDEAKKTGMQLIAAYLEGKGDSPLQLLNKQDQQQQAAVRRGMVEALLRNIFLPRDDHARKRTEQATRGLLDLAGGAGDIASICQEMQHVIGQYQQHRDQLKSQLEEQMRMQYEQLLAQQMGGQAEGMQIDPTTQPKFQEEWARVEAELDDQYNQSLAQYKEQLQHRLAL